MLDILAAADYYHAAASQPLLPDLREAVNALCRERPRRIDRYTQLALLGALRCAANITLPPTTGLYMGSRFASLSNTIAMHQQMIEQGDSPKPAHFINSLSNSAGYYVARNLNLQQRNLFISRADASLIATLQIAALDIYSAAITHALVGIVEEAVLPVQQHCLRLGVDLQTQLGEGSHWLVLTKSSAANDQSMVLGQIDELLTLPDTFALTAWLAAMKVFDANCQLYAPVPTRKQFQCELNAIAPFAPELAYYPAVTACALQRFLFAKDNHAGTLLCVIADEQRRFHVLRLSRAARQLA